MAFLRKPVLVFAAFTALLLFLLLVPLKRWLGDSYAMTALLDIMHAPAFAIFAVLLYRAVRPAFSNRVVAGIVCWVFVVLLGIGVEFAQQYTGRGTTWKDALANAAGATAGLLAMAALFRPNWHQRGALLVVAVALLSVCSIGPLRVLAEALHAWRVLPMLASFEQSGELGRWESGNCRMSRQNRHATEGQWALRADYEPARYSRVGLRFFPSDWTAYRTLLCDVTLSPGEPVELTIKIQDRWHTGDYLDRFHQTFLLHPGRQTMRVALDRVESAPATRSMDLEQLRWVEFYTVDLDHPRTLYFDNMRLE